VSPHAHELAWLATYNAALTGLLAAGRATGDAGAEAEGCADAVHGSCQCPIWWRSARDAARAGSIAQYDAAAEGGAL
jgi:hypothetical protein